MLLAGKVNHSSQLDISGCMSDEKRDVLELPVLVQGILLLTSPGSIGYHAFANRHCYCGCRVVLPQSLGHLADDAQRLFALVNSTRACTVSEVGMNILLA